jgi:hypothetical protein
MFFSVRSMHIMHRKKQLGLDLSAAIHAGYVRWGKYELLDALITHFSDVCFAEDLIIYQELKKMFDRKAYYPPRNKYTIYIEAVILEWLRCGAMYPDPRWWMKKSAHWV